MVLLEAVVNRLQETCRTLTMFVSIEIQSGMQHGELVELIHCFKSNIKIGVLCIMVNKKFCL